MGKSRDSAEIDQSCDSRELGESRDRGRMSKLWDFVIWEIGETRDYEKGDLLRMDNSRDTEGMGLSHVTQYESD